MKLQGRGTHVAPLFWTKMRVARNAYLNQKSEELVVEAPGIETERRCCFDLGFYMISGRI